MNAYIWVPWPGTRFRLLIRYLDHGSRDPTPNFVGKEHLHNMFAKHGTEIDSIAFWRPVLELICYVNGPVTSLLFGCVSSFIHLCQDSTHTCRMWRHMCARTESRMHHNHTKMRSLIDAMLFIPLFLIYTCFMVCCMSNRIRKTHIHTLKTHRSSNSKATQQTRRGDNNKDDGTTNPRVVDVARGAKLSVRLSIRCPSAKAGSLFVPQINLIEQEGAVYENKTQPPALPPHSIKRIPASAIKERHHEWARLIPQHQSLLAVYSVLGLCTSQTTCCCLPLESFNAEKFCVWWCPVDRTNPKTGGCRRQRGDSIPRDGLGYVYSGLGCGWHCVWENANIQRVAGKECLEYDVCVYGNMIPTHPWNRRVPQKGEGVEYSHNKYDASQQTAFVSCSRTKFATSFLVPTNWPDPKNVVHFNSTKRKPHKTTKPMFDAWFKNDNLLCSPK